MTSSPQSATLIKVGKHGVAADLQKISRSFREWAVSQGLTKFNIMAGLRAPSRSRHQRLQDAQEKGKALTDIELVAVWRAAQAMQERAARGERVSGSLGRAGATGFADRDGAAN